MVDTQDRWVYLNHEGDALGEWVPFAVADWLSFIHPDDRERAEACFREGLEKRSGYSIEYRVVTSSGAVRWVNGVASTRFDARGDYAGLSGTVLDITQERLARESLHQREARFRSLTDMSVDWYWETDVNDCFTFMADGIVRHTGRLPSTYLGKTRRDLSVMPDQPALLDYYRKVAAREPFRDLRYAVKSPDPARKRIVTISGEPIFEDGQFVGYRGVGREISEEVRVAEALEESRDELASMVESIGDAFFALDRDWCVTWVNQNTANFIGRPREEVLGQHVNDAAKALVASDVFRHFQHAMDTGENVFFETFYAPQDAWVEVRIYSHAKGLSVFFHDISERRLAEAAARELEARRRKVIALTPAGYVFTDAHGRLEEVNPAMCAMTGFNETELIGREMVTLLPDCPLVEALAQQGGPSTAHGYEAVIRHRDGHTVYVLLNVSIDRDAAGNALSLTAFITDISTRKQAEARLERLATHDELTGLPNRTLINSQLERMLAARAADSHLAVMFIDLDRFKEVNDAMGHAPGDRLLRQVAARLQRVMRPADMVARLGGDEFIAAVECPTGMADAAAVARRLLDALKAPFDIDGNEIFISASIGISMAPDDGHTNELLFQNADAAMYRAKAAGRNDFCFYAPRMRAETRDRVTIEQGLRRALERDEFTLHYQPRIDLRTMAVTGMEALIRWQHPELGAVAPVRFISIAEERGHIEAIGNWVLHEACRQSVCLMEKYRRSLHLSVNLSARQLRCADLVEQVRSALSDSGFPPEMLELELTESALIEDVEVSAAVLRQLKDLGLRLSVDDFGTGYSSLAYLRRFPLDILKLDRAFLNRKADGVDSFEFVKAFIDMAHALGLSVVAEGVEDKETVQFLRGSACDEAQGYLFARPLSLPQFENYLARLPS